MVTLLCLPLEGRRGRGRGEWGGRERRERLALTKEQRV